MVGFRDKEDIVNTELVHSCMTLLRSDNHWVHRNAHAEACYCKTVDERHTVKVKFIPFSFTCVDMLFVCKNNALALCILPAEAVLSSSKAYVGSP